MNTANKSTLKEIIQTKLETYFRENSLTPSDKKRKEVIQDIRTSHKSNGRSLTLNQVINDVLEKHFSNGHASDDDSSSVSSVSSVSNVSNLFSLLHHLHCLYCLHFIY